MTLIRIQIYEKFSILWSRSKSRLGPFRSEYSAIGEWIVQWIERIFSFNMGESSKTIW